jgi:general stress protein 26
MISLTDEMREHIDNALPNRKPCLLVTASAQGYPGVGYRGSMMVFDDEHLAYWKRPSGGAREHVLENPHVAVFFRDPETRVGWRFFGDVQVFEDGPTREGIWERTVQPERDRDPEKQGSAVLIRVDRILAINQDVVQDREVAGA